MAVLKLFEYLRSFEIEQINVENDSLFLKAQWIQYYLRKVDRVFSIYHPFYTLHNYLHFDAVVTYLYEIIERAGLLDNLDKSALSYSEVFYLIAAAYLHDIGMILKFPDDDKLARQDNMPLGEIIRRDHHLRSAKFVRDHANIFLLQPQEVDIIGALCEGHRLDSLHNSSFDDRYDNFGNPIRVRLLAGLLQVADELDMSSKRAPAYERIFMDKLTQFNSLSRLHWMKHYYTESVSFSREEKNRKSLQIIKINIALALPDEAHQLYLQREIGNRVDRHLKSLSFFREYGFDIQLGEFTTRFNPQMISSILSPNQVRILYADDDSYYRVQVADELRERGFSNCHTVENAHQVIAEVARSVKQQYHIVILDLMMENLDGVDAPDAGLELLDPVRRFAPTAQVILFTGSASDEHGAELLQEARLQSISVVSKDGGLRVLIDEVEKAIRMNYILDEQNAYSTGGSSMTNLYVPDTYRILVVDDDDEWAQRIIDELNEIGMGTDRATGADVAVQKLKASRYHAAVLDKQMNNISGRLDDNAGLELLTYMRDNHEDVSCFVLTSTGNVPFFRTAESIGMFDYRDKEAVGPHEIAQIISEMLKSRLVNVRNYTDMMAQAERMYFYRKTGTVIKTVTRDTGADAGIVEIEGEKWRATTSKTERLQTIDPIPAGTKIIAYGIFKGCIQVAAEVY